MFTTHINYNGFIFTVNVTSFTPDKPTHIHCAPEDSYPEEAGEVEYEVVNIQVDCVESVEESLFEGVFDADHFTNLVFAEADVYYGDIENY